MAKRRIYLDEEPTYYGQTSDNTAKRPVNESYAVPNDNTFVSRNIIDTSSKGYAPTFKQIAQDGTFLTYGKPEFHNGIQINKNGRYYIQRNWYPYDSIYLTPRQLDSINEVRKLVNEKPKEYLFKKEYRLGGRINRLKYGGKVPPIAAPYLAIRGGLKKVKDYIANRAYNTVNPGNSYDIPTVIDAFVNPNNHPEQYDDDYDGIARGNTDELYAMYLGIPTLQRHTNKRLNKSKYRKGEYALNLDDYSIKSLITQGNPIPLGKNKIKHLAFADLNESAVGRGHDAQGEYISYGDRYDLNPFRGTWATMKGSKVQKALEHFNDLSFGLFNPVDIYDRIYLDDYYNVPKKYRGNYYLPEVEVWPTGTGIVGRSYVDNYKLDGTIRPQFKYGGIHIKKKNRGKFTATMKRTGKSAEELSHSKNPLTRKRAIFALNARKWNRKKK